MDFFLITFNRTIVIGQKDPHMSSDINIDYPLKQLELPDWARKFMHRDRPALLSKVIPRKEPGTEKMKID